MSEPIPSYSYIRTIDSPESYYKIKQIYKRDRINFSHLNTSRNEPLPSSLNQSPSKRPPDPINKFFRIRKTNRIVKIKSPEKKVPGLDFSKMSERQQILNRPVCLSEHHFNNYQLERREAKGIEMAKYLSRDTSKVKKSINLQYQTQKIYERLHFGTPNFFVLARLGEPRLD